jgi:hypothetical protein
MTIPYFAIGNNELAVKKPIGKMVKCPHCGKLHKVKYGETVNKDGTRTPSKTLGFVDCGKSSYLVAVAGKKL